LVVAVAGWFGLAAEPEVVEGLGVAVAVGAELQQVVATAG